MATQEAVTILSNIIRQFKFTLVNEDQFEKWGVWNENPEERKGRYSVALTLGIRNGMDFMVEKI
jgi:hypothetical protein